MLTSVDTLADLRKRSPDVPPRPSLCVPVVTELVTDWLIEPMSMTGSPASASVRFWVVPSAHLGGQVTPLRDLKKG